MTKHDQEVLVPGSSSRKVLHVEYSQDNSGDDPVDYLNTEGNQIQVGVYLVVVYPLSGVLIIVEDRVV